MIVAVRVFGRGVVCGFKLSQFGWPLLLGCGAGLVVPAVAAPADVRVVAADPGSPGSSTTGVGSQFELIYWQSIAASEDAGQFQAYLEQYPNGTFSALARAKIAALARRDDRANPGAATAATSPVPPAHEPAAPGAADDDLVRTPEVPDSTAMAAAAPPPAPSPNDPATASTPCDAPVYSSNPGETGSHAHTVTPAP